MVTIRVYSAIELSAGTAVCHAPITHRSTECVHVKEAVGERANLIGITVGKCIRNPLQTKGFFAAVSVMGPTLYDVRGSDGEQTDVQTGASLHVGNRQLIVLREVDDDHMALVLV